MHYNICVLLILLLDTTKTNTIIIYSIILLNSSIQSAKCWPIHYKTLRSDFHYNHVFRYAALDEA